MQGKKIIYFEPLFWCLKTPFLWPIIFRWVSVGMSSQSLESDLRYVYCTLRVRGFRFICFRSKSFAFLSPLLLSSSSIPSSGCHVLFLMHSFAYVYISQAHWPENIHIPVWAYLSLYNSLSSTPTPILISKSFLKLQTRRLFHCCFAVFSTTICGDCLSGHFLV